MCYKWKGAKIINIQFNVYALNNNIYSWPFAVHTIETQGTLTLGFSIFCQSVLGMSPI